MIKDVKDMSHAELLKEYNYTKNKIDGVIEGGFGKYELYYMEELLNEMDRKEV